MGILSGCMRCIGCIICAVILLIALIVIAIMFSVYTPEPPIINFHSLNVTGLSASGSSVSGAFAASLVVMTKKYHAYFDDWEVKILYKDMEIGSGKIDKFDMGTGGDIMGGVEKRFNINATASSLDSEKVKELESDRSKGTVNFDVEMETKQVLKWNRHMHSPKWDAKEECPMEVKFGSGSKGSEGNSYSENNFSCSSKLKKKGWWFESGKVEN